MKLRAENILFAYPERNPVVRNISLELEPGTVTGLFGPNGCGKTTLLRCLNGTLQPQQGRVMIDDVPLNSLSRREIALHIATLSQDIPAQLPFSVGEVVMLGRYPSWQMLRHETVEDYEIVAGCMEQMDIREFANRPFDTLSGGEKQRTLLARALAQQSPILLLDEPAAHLDITRHLNFLKYLRKIAASGKSILLVCHDLFAAPMFLDRAFLLNDGMIVSSGTVAEVLSPDNLKHVFACPVNISHLPGNNISIALNMRE
ncbi:MAG: ABC transporter ATP-binding protein [Victivallaceae bacterium]